MMYTGSTTFSTFSLCVRAPPRKHGSCGGPVGPLGGSVVVTWFGGSARSRQDGAGSPDDASTAHDGGGTVDGVDDDLLTGLDVVTERARRPRLARELDPAPRRVDAVDGDGRAADVGSGAHELLGRAGRETVLQPRTDDREQCHGDEGSDHRLDDGRCTEGCGDGRPHRASGEHEEGEVDGDRLDRDQHEGHPEPDHPGVSLEHVSHPAFSESATDADVPVRHTSDVLDSASVPSVDLRIGQPGQVAIRTRLGPTTARRAAPARAGRRRLR